MYKNMIDCLTIDIERVRNQKANKNLELKGKINAGLETTRLMIEVPV